MLRRVFTSGVATAAWGMNKGFVPLGATFTRAALFYPHKSGLTTAQQRFARGSGGRAPPPPSNQQQQEWQTQQQQRPTEYDQPGFGQSYGDVQKTQKAAPVDYTAPYGGATASQVVGKDQGLSNFLSRSMLATAGGVLTAGAGTMLAMAGILPVGSFWLPFLASMGGIFAMGMMSPTQHVDKNGHLYTTNSVGRIAAANLVYGSIGWLVAPMLLTAPVSVSLAALCATLGTAGGMAAFALTRPQGSMLKLGAPLMVALFGMIALSLGSMFFGGMSSGMSLLFGFGGVGIFSLFTAYDIHKAIQMYTIDRNADHLSVATSMFLNLYNLFISFMRIFNNE